PASTGSSRSTTATRTCWTARTFAASSGTRTLIGKPTIGLPVTAGFPHLLAPGRIGAMAVRNRVVMSPMETMCGTRDGLPSQRTRDYFAARAKGGVGLITLGATGVDHHHPETPGGL